MARNIMRLVQVEDDPNEVYFFDWVVRRWNLPIASHVATTGKVALDYLRLSESLPDMLLLDINMPQMSGFDILKALRQKPEWKDIPVVMFSNSSEPSDVQRSRELGAQAYFVKPDDPEAMAKILEKIHSTWVQSKNLDAWPDDPETPPAHSAAA